VRFAGRRWQLQKKRPMRFAGSLAALQTS